MTELAIERRVFVVGAPRSGTTLVQSLLAAHPSLTSFTESHLFSRHFRLLPPTSAAVLVRDPAPRLSDFLRENRVEPGEIEALTAEPMPARVLLPFATRAVARRLLRVFDQLARLRGKPGWVEKTPRHLRYLPFLERLYGATAGVSFVHVIRDGLEVVASLHEASKSWERAYDLDTCVARWNADVAFSLKRAGSPRDRFVVYERLTTDPESTMEALFAGLGLDWRPEILEHFSSRGLVTREETWKAGVDGGVRPSATSSRVLSDEQRHRVRRGLRQDLYDRLFERHAPPPAGIRAPTPRSR